MSNKVFSNSREMLFLLRPEIVKKNKTHSTQLNPTHMKETSTLLT